MQNTFMISTYCCTFAVACTIHSTWLQVARQCNVIFASFYLASDKASEKLPKGATNTRQWTLNSVNRSPHKILHDLPA